MTERTALELDTLTIRIPIRLRRRGGRKLIVTPEGAAVPAPSHAETRRWSRRSFAPTAGGGSIESGQAKSITDLAEQEGVTDAYACRLLPLDLPRAGHRRGDSSGRVDLGRDLKMMVEARQFQRR